MTLAAYDEDSQTATRPEGIWSMYTGLQISQLCKKGTVLFAVLVVTVLALVARPAEADICTTCGGGGGTTNSPPTVSANQPSVTVPEGQTATNTGTYDDSDGDPVTLTASAGNVSEDAAGSGTWSWSFGTSDGPAQNQMVTITASDGIGSSTTTFSLNVTDVSPTATFNVPQSSYAGKTFVISLTNPSDPSGTDTSAGFTYAFDCGSGYGARTASSVATCPAGSGASTTVKGEVFDKDGGFTEYRRTVTVNAAPPSHANGKLASVSNRDGNYEIYTMNPDGSGVSRLTYGGGLDPSFSPDGSRIAFTSGRDGNYEIYTMNANGSNQTRLTNNAAEDRSAVFSPDGSKIAFMSKRDGNYDIYIMNADGSGQTRLTNNPADDEEPTFSPDGSQIAFESNRDGTYNYEIYTMNSDGSGQTRLTNNPAADFEPAFSPDGSKIAFVSDRDNTSSSNRDIYTMNADGSGVTRLTNSPYYGTDAAALHPVFSADGSKIAFFIDHFNENNDEIYTMNTSGSYQTRLTSNTVLDADPTWGGAGDTVAPETTIDSGPSGSVESDSATFGFSSSESDSTFECELDGGSFSPCSSPKDYTDLSWGEHTLQVRAIDKYGNIDPSPASRTWTVEPIVLTSPADGATVGGPVQLSAKVSDFVATVDHVEFLVNGSVVGSDITAPYSVPWNSTSVTSGDTAQLTARVYDTSNDQGTSAAHTVTVDNLAPTVLSTSPVKGATKVQRKTNVSADFSEAMNPASLTSKTFMLQQWNAKKKKWIKIPATVSAGNQTATLDPYGATEGATEKPLAAKSKFKATITTGAMDVAGNPLAKTFSWTFITKGT